MAVVLALAAAASWGSSDFLAGLASRRSSAPAVVVGSQLAGLALVTALVPLLPGVPLPADLAWGAAAGVGGGAGIALLYRGLAVGRMSIVAPVTAALGASVPVVFGLLAGERPPPLGLAGVAAALLAVVLVSVTPADGSARGRPRLCQPGLGYAVGAGVAFGAFFVLLDHAAPASGLWPLLGAKTSSVLMLGGGALLTRRRALPALGDALPVAAVGALEVGGAALFLLANNHGLLSIVAVVGSLYPAATVVLARLFLQERLTQPQLASLGAGAIGLALIAAA